MQSITYDHQHAATFSNTYHLTHTEDGMHGGAEHGMPVIRAPADLCGVWSGGGDPRSPHEPRRGSEGHGPSRPQGSRSQGGIGGTVEGHRA